MDESTVSTPRRKAAKPSKPHPDFPLFPHATGRWAKKVRGKLNYFGPWADPEAALNLWLDQKDDLLAGRTPRTKRGGLTVGDLCNRFLTFKIARVNSGELHQRTFGDYYQICHRIVGAFGKNRLVDDLASDDFERFRQEFAKTRGLVGIANAVRLTRIVFRYASEAALVDRAVRFGPTFKVPDADKIRKVRNARPPRMFEAAEIKRILRKSDKIMRAMVLLAVNCGFGQTDIANLPQSALDLERGWVDFPRVKTGVPRRIPLWPETTKAVKFALPLRPKARDAADAGLVFLTQQGRRWVRAGTVSENGGGGAMDSIALEFGKVLGKLKLKRPGRGFYALRHVTGTIGSDSLDQVAVNAIMGHLPADDDIPGRYRERGFGEWDSRLQKVVTVVHDWLFPVKTTAKPGAKRK